MSASSFRRLSRSFLAACSRLSLRKAKHPNQLRPARGDRRGRTHSSGLIALNSTVVSSYGARQAGQRPLRFSLMWW